MTFDEWIKGRCPRCLRMEATEEQWDTMQPGEGADLCWGSANDECWAIDIKDALRGAWEAAVRSAGR